METSDTTEASSHSQAEADGGRSPLKPSRRTILGTTAVSLVAGAVAGGGTAAAMDRSDTSTRIVDVACIGDTLKLTAVPAISGLLPDLYGGPVEPGDLMGSPFAVEGLIFPEGTIAGDGFVPNEDESIGVWICRGYFINGPRRPEPHMSTDQVFHFGPLAYDSGIGRELLLTSGFEGASEDGWSVQRVVTGGTGPYAGVRGACTQTNISRNATVFPHGKNGLDFRFEFELS